LIDGDIVLRLEPVEMDGEGEIDAGLEQVEFLLQKQGVGAEIDELLALDDAGDDLGYLLVDERFAAGNGNHRGATFVHRR